MDSEIALLEENEGRDDNDTDEATTPHNNNTDDDDDFHCYLLRSQDPKHPYKTYVGFTVDPHRRLRQHNGLLKHGGAWRTKKSGRPWTFTCIVYGFKTQKLALQFEWAWQHCDKSKVVRKSIGDTEAKHIKRKRAYRGQLWILKTLLLRVPDLYEKQPLTIYFFDETIMSIYETIPIVASLDADNVIFKNIHDVKLVESVEAMPFFPKRKKRVPKKRRKGQRQKSSKNQATEDDEAVTVAQIPKQQQQPQRQRPKDCMWCHRPVSLNEEYIQCFHCYRKLHRICADISLKSDDCFCPSCHAPLSFNASSDSSELEDDDVFNDDDDENSSVDETETKIAGTSWRRNKGHLDGFKDSDSDSDESSWERCKDSAHQLPKALKDNKKYQTTNANVSVARAVTLDDESSSTSDDDDDDYRPGISNRKNDLIAEKSRVPGNINIRKLPPIEGNLFLGHSSSSSSSDDDDDIMIMTSPHKKERFSHVGQEGSKRGIPDKAKPKLDAQQRQQKQRINVNRNYRFGRSSSFDDMILASPDRKNHRRRKKDTPMGVGAGGADDLCLSSEPSSDDDMELATPPMRKLGVWRQESSNQSVINIDSSSGDDGSSSCSSLHRVIPHSKTHVSVQPEIIDLC